MGAKLVAPDWLSDQAKEFWPTVVKDLRALGAISRLDTVALALYCESFSTWRVALGEIAESSPVIKAPSGYPVQHPYVAIANRAHEQMIRLLIEFGMTPKSRGQSREEKPGKKEQKQKAAERVASGKFAAAAAPKLIVNNR